MTARRMLCLITCLGFRLTSHASSRINANLNVGLEQGIGSNFQGETKIQAW